MRGTLSLVGLACAASISTASAEVQDCIAITALPAVITQQGVHCLKQDLTTSATSGNAITVNANNVIIELNGFKLGGLGAGSATTANGIYAFDRQNVTIRNGSVRGFRVNISIDATNDLNVSNSKGHLVEFIRSERGTFAGILVEGTNTVVRNNLIFETGNSSVGSTATGIIAQIGRGISVTGNIVSGVTETNTGTGISLATAPGIMVIGNEIRNLSGTTMRGVFVAGSDRSIIKDNIISNDTPGTQGIGSTSGSTVCLDNVIVNFTTSLSGCSLENGNRGL